MELLNQKQNNCIVLNKDPFLNKTSWADIDATFDGLIQEYAQNLTIRRLSDEELDLVSADSVQRFYRMRFRLTNKALLDLNPPEFTQSWLYDNMMLVDTLSSTHNQLLLHIELCACNSSMEIIPITAGNYKGFVKWIPITPKLWKNMSNWVSSSFGTCRRIVLQDRNLDEIDAALAQLKFSNPWFSYPSQAVACVDCTKIRSLLQCLCLLAEMFGEHDAAKTAMLGLQQLTLNLKHFESSRGLPIDPYFRVAELGFLFFTYKQIMKLYASNPEKFCNNIGGGWFNLLFWDSPIYFPYQSFN